MVAFQLPAGLSQDTGTGAPDYIAAPGNMEDAFDGRRVQQRVPKPARQRCASAPARRAPSARPQPVHPSPLAVKGRALQHNICGEATGFGAGPARAIPIPPRQSSPGACGPAARPKRRTEGSNITAADTLYHPALPRIRTHADDGAAGKRHLPGSRDELRALFRAYNLPVPRALPPPSHRTSAAGGHASSRPVSGLAAKGAQQARPHPAAHPYHQRLRGLLDASSHAMHGAVPVPGRRVSLVNEQLRGPSAQQRASKQQAASRGAPVVAAVAVPKLGRHSDAGAEPLPMVLGRPLEVNQGYQAVLPGGGGQPGNRARQDKVLVSEHQSQPAEGAGDEHEQWDWVYRGPPTPESPYGSDILRAMLDVVSPRFEVRRPEGYIPITPSSIASSRYVRSDVWSWSCPGSPAVGFRPAPDGCADAGAAAAGGGGGGGASSLGRSPFAAARPNPARPMPRQSSPEPLHRKLLLRAAAAAATAGGAPPLSRQGSRQSSALSAALQVAEAHDHGHGMAPPGGGDWNPSLRLRAEHQHGHLMPHLVAAGRASHDSRDPAHVEAPSRSTPESHEHSAQQQHLQQQQQPVDYSSGPTPPPGKSRFYQQQQHHQPHEHALPQITPRQQVGTAAVLRRVSESGLPAATYDWQPSVSTLSNHNGAATPTRDLCTPRAALQLSHLPQRGSSAGRFSRAAAMASPVQGVQADGSRGGQLAFVMPSPAGPGLRPRGTPGRCVDLLWEPPPIQPSRALDRHRSGSRTPSPERTIRGESGPRMHNLAEAAAARLRQAAAVSGSRRTSSSPSPLPSVRRTGSHAGEAPSAEGGAARVAQPQQPYRSSSPSPVAVSARRVLYRPDGPSLSVGPAARSTSAYMRGRSAQEDTAAVSLLESQFAVRPRSSPAARAAAAALARAQHAMADSGGTSSAAATGVAPLRLGGMHGADTVASDSAFPTLLLPSPLRHHGSSDMVNTHTRQAGTGGSAFSFHMSAAATGAADTSAYSWPGAPTPALCKGPVSRQSSQGRRKWALPANSAPSSPRVQLFPVPDDDGSNTSGASKAASSPLCARGGDGARTPGSHRKRYVSLRRAGLARRNSVAAAAGSVACMQTAQSHTACSSPFTTPRELSSDAAAPGSGSDCGGAPSTGAMVGSSVDSWGTCLAAALPATGQPQAGGGTPLSTGADNVSPELQQKQPQLGDVTRTRAPMPSRFGPLSPAAALAQRSRYSSPAVRPGLRGSSPAAVSPFMGPGSVGDMTPPMSPLRQPQPSPLTAGVSAAADGVRRNLLSSFWSASACRPATSPVAGAPSASDVTPRCPAPRPASLGQRRASGLCPTPPQQMQRCLSAQQARRRQCDWPSPAQSQDLQSRPLAPLPPLAPSVPPTTRAASPSRQAKHGDTRCDQDVERRVAAGPPPAGRFAPQPPLAPRDSLAPRRPSTSGSIRSSKESVGSARGASAALATSTDDDVAAGHVDARAVHTPNGPSAAPYPNQRLVQPAHPQRSILDSPDLGPKKARPSVDGTYLTPAGVSSRPASAASRCSSAGASDSSRSRHWSYRRARERAVFLNGVFAVAASSATVEERVLQAGVPGC